MSREFTHESESREMPVNSEVRKRVAALNLKNPRLPRTAEACAGVALLHLRECYRMRRASALESDPEQKALFEDLAREEEIQFKVFLGLRRKIRFVRSAS